MCTVLFLGWPLFHRGPQDRKNILALFPLTAILTILEERFLVQIVFQLELAQTPVSQFCVFLVRFSPTRRAKTKPPKTLKHNTKYKNSKKQTTGKNDYNSSNKQERTIWRRKPEAKWGRNATQRRIRRKNGKLKQTAKIKTIKRRKPRKQKRKRTKHRNK